MQSSHVARDWFHSQVRLGIASLFLFAETLDLVLSTRIAFERIAILTIVLALLIAELYARQQRRVAPDLSVDLVLHNISLGDYRDISELIFDHLHARTAPRKAAGSTSAGRPVIAQADKTARVATTAASGADASGRSVGTQHAPRNEAGPSEKTERPTTRTNVEGEVASPSALARRPERNHPGDRYQPSEDAVASSHRDEHTHHLLVPDDLRPVPTSQQWFDHNPIQWDRLNNDFENSCKTALGPDLRGAECVVDLLCRHQNEMLLGFAGSLLSTLKLLASNRPHASLALLHPIRGVLCGTQDAPHASEGLGLEPFGWEYIGREPMIFWPGAKLPEMMNQRVLCDPYGVYAGEGSKVPLEGAKVDQVLFPGFRLGTRIVTFPTLRFTNSSMDLNVSASAKVEFPLDRGLGKLVFTQRWWPDQPATDRRPDAFRLILEQSQQTLSPDSLQRLRRVFYAHLDRIANATLMSLESACALSLQAYAAIVYPLRTAFLTHLSLRPYGWEFIGKPRRELITHVQAARTLQHPQSCIVRATSRETDRDAIVGLLFPGFCRDDSESGASLATAHAPTVVVEGELA